ncbi:MAG: SEC-C motif-containing protein [bacterium]|jgi:SEC-C motif-containing protein
MNVCPCGSQDQFEECCAPLLAEEKQAETAEQLMRSRYTAYTTKNVDYIIATTLPKNRNNCDLEGMKEWAESATWEKLEIVQTKAGQTEDKAGEVEFIAHFSQKEEKKVHHELSTFTKENGQWFFESGKTPSKQYIRTAEKVGRNDPCNCESGKKYKKCCGKAA